MIPAANTRTLRREDLPHYTYNDYMHWEGQWELIYGIPYAMAPAPTIPHQRICSKINWLLREALKDCGKCEVLWPVDWPITDDIVVQPDLLVVCREKEDESIGTKKLEKTPVMVFEVLSPATSKKDRVLKYQLYEKAGVKYYCIVDPDTNSVTVFVLQADNYRDAGELENGGMGFDLGPCRIQLDFGSVF